MFVYRIVFKVFSKDLIASGLEGRWNSEGKKVIYAAGSIALAFLENMVRRQGVGFNDDFRIMIVNIPDKLRIENVNTDDLNSDWRNFRDYSNCQSIGDDWYDRGDTSILKVPSAVVPEECNYVINATHRDYKKIKIIDTTALMPDPRIDEILKKSRKRLMR